jgi:hypothetical protein
MKERTIQAVGILGIVAVFGLAFLAKFFVSDELTIVLFLVSLLLYVVTLVWILGVPVGRDAIKRWKEQSLPAPAEPVEARAQTTSATEAKAQHDLHSPHFALSAPTHHDLGRIIRQRSLPGKGHGVVEELG